MWQQQKKIGETGAGYRRQGNRCQDQKLCRLSQAKHHASRGAWRRPGTPGRGVLAESPAAPESGGVKTSPDLGFFCADTEGSREPRLGSSRAAVQAPQHGFSCLNEAFYARSQQQHRQHTHGDEGRAKEVGN